mgnify:FL=1
MRIETEISGKNNLKDEILFQNPLFKDNNGNMFKFPSLANKKGYMPKKFKDLPISIPVTKINPNHRNLISELNKCFWKFNDEPLTGKIRYVYSIGDDKFDILELSLRNLYRNQISLIGK